MRQHNSLILTGILSLVLGGVFWANARAQDESTEGEEVAKSEAEIVRHVVLFQFKEAATEEEIAKIEAGFAGLKDKIEGIIDFEWGTNSSPEGLNDDFTHCFVVTFSDAKARDAYLPHEDHQEFVKQLRPLLEKALVVDYTPK